MHAYGKNNKSTTLKIEPVIGKLAQERFLSTDFATALRVSNTPVPLIATASNEGNFLGLSSCSRSSTEMISGRSRLLY